VLGICDKFPYTTQNPQALGDSWGTKRVEFDYEGVVESVERLGGDLGYSWGVVGHLMGVKNSDELRTAHDEIQPKIVEIYQKLGQSKPLFNALKALKARQSIWRNLDEAQQRIITASIRQMESSGVGLEASDKEAFNKLQLEAAELSTKFSNNVLDSTKAFKLVLTRKEEIDGLTESARALAAQTSLRNDPTCGATAENGPWTLTLDMPSYLPAMQHMKDRTVREQLYRAYVTRASNGDKDNAPIIQRILQLKSETSKLLGFSSFAERSLSAKMAPNANAVLELIEMLREKSMPAAKRELAELQTFAKSCGLESELQLWDIAFYSERLREAQYEFEEETLRPYFALPNVLDGLFSLCNRLFGITIEVAVGEAQVSSGWYYRGSASLFFFLSFFSSQVLIMSSIAMALCLYLGLASRRFIL